MSATVQATCPGCRNVLRIPASWADKALKCKKCGTVVQARKKLTTASEAGSPSPALPVVKAVPVAPTQAAPASPPVYPQAVATPQASPAGSDLSSFISEEDAYSPATRRYRAKKHRPWVGPLIVFSILATAAGGAYVFKDRLVQLTQGGAVESDGETAAAVATDGTTKTTTTKLSDPFPRRLLFVHISKYVYFNALASGKTGRGDDQPSETAKKMQFELRVPTDKENNQFFSLIDTAPDEKRPPLKATVKFAYEQFFETSREQDRIAMYFGGHAVEIDGKGYLVPLEGEPELVETLIPLEEFYAKLGACKAQQKLVIFDVCRFNPGYGAAKPGSEPMSEGLQKALHSAPPGVQVVTSCSAGENAQESKETGSEFLTAFRIVASGARGVRTNTPDAAIPVAPWTDALRATLAAGRRQSQPQTPKLSGTESATVVAYNREEPAARRFEWPTAPKGASVKDVERLLELANLPGLRKELELNPIELAEVFPFPEEKMRAYASDGITEEQIKKDSDKYPIRIATINAMEILKKNWTTMGDAGGLRESFEGSADEKVKRAIQQEQEPLAKLSLAIKDALTELEEAESKLGEEKSPRWKTLFQYTLAQAQMRWAYLEEYNLSLGNIRTDSLQQAPPGSNPVWRLVSVAKMKSKREVKDKAEASKELMAQIAEENKGTPWEILAKMHKDVALGLDWKLVESKKEDESLEMKK